MATFLERAAHLVYRFGFEGVTLVLIASSFPDYCLSYTSSIFALLLSGSDSF